MKQEKISGFDNIIGGKGIFIGIGMGYRHKELAQQITCVDGTKLSVQASEMHYCRPRTDEGPYTHVEVGFPSVAPPESWADSFDGDWENDDPTGSVYGQVPIELVQEYIEAHGGETTKADTPV